MENSRGHVRFLFFLTHFRSMSVREQTKVSFGGAVFFLG
jgi:hypothetical protein